MAICLRFTLYCLTFVCFCLGHYHHHMPGIGRKRRNVVFMASQEVESGKSGDL